MRQHNDTVSRQVHISLNGVGADFDRTPKCSHRVLGPCGIIPTVSNGLR